MMRPDGSIRSTNVPAWDNRYQVRDFGIYRGVVRDVIYTDDEDNDSGGANDANEVLYNVMIVGGDRDGQLFQNARLMRSLGGWDNSEELTLKATEGVTKQDPSSPLAVGDPTISSVPRFNGDVVYIQFLNGDLTLPVIVGLGYHQLADAEAAEDDGPRFRRRFNGIVTEITKDGEFSWSKDNGAYVPFLLNTANPLYPYVSQFAPLPGQDGAVTLTLGNEYDLSFDFGTGLNVTIDGLADEFSFTTAAGASYTLNGLEDSHELGTTVGTVLSISGIEDSISISTSAGAGIDVKGLEDSVDISTSAGAGVTVSGLDGVSIQDALGDSVDLSEGAVTIQNAIGAQLVLDKTGFIKLGNAGGDVIKDVLQALIQSLSTASYSGFGAPGSNVADLVQLLVKCQLITGG